MITLFEYEVRMRIVAALQREQRFVIDCWVCGDPWSYHELVEPGLAGACPRPFSSRLIGLSGWIDGA